MRLVALCFGTERGLKRPSEDVREAGQLVALCVGTERGKQIIRNVFTGFVILPFGNNVGGKLHCGGSVVGPVVSAGLGLDSSVVSRVAATGATIGPSTKMSFFLRASVSVTTFVPTPTINACPLKLPLVATLPVTCPFENSTAVSMRDPATRQRLALHFPKWSHPVSHLRPSKRPFHAPETPLSCVSSPMNVSQCAESYAPIMSPRFRRRS
jgi:hypothetical protein